MLSQAAKSQFTVELYSNAVLDMPGEKKKKKKKITCSHTRICNSKPSIIRRVEGGKQLWLCVHVSAYVCLCFVLPPRLYSDSFIRAVREQPTPRCLPFTVSLFTDHHFCHPV